MLCSCYAIVIDDSLECSSASEGIYTAIVLSQSRDAESLVEELHGPLVEAILGKFITCDVSPNKLDQFMGDFPCSYI